MNQYQLPPPEAFGLPVKFTSWRQDQERAILLISQPETRFTISNKPTGGGKSLDYITAAILSGKRTAILTSTKGLQHQLYRDFGQEPGATIVMGKNEYKCQLFPISCEYGPCRFGLACSYKKSGCPYYDNLAKARNSNIIITNYAFWFKHRRLFEAIGPIDFLVCDEAHDTTSKMLDALSLTLTQWTCENILKIDLPDNNLGDEHYWSWIKDISKQTIAYVEQISKDKHILREKINDKRFQAICDFAQRFANIIIDADPTQWVVEHTGKALTFDPIQPLDFAEEMLFKDISQILLTSATINSGMVEYLGPDKEDITYYEFDSYFPAKNHPITFIPTVRVYGKYRMKEQDYRIWLSRIDNIIGNRLDRNGIIHSVSYDNCKIIYAQSEYSDQMIIHDSKDREKMIQYFKSNKDNPPNILLSPSITTGYDFPGRECEYQIITKIFFPDARRKVDKIRRELNPDYYNNMTMITLEQACGRGWRFENDRCETSIIDNHWLWFKKKNERFMHRWFKRLLRQSNTIPEPQEKL
ncbi:MAG: helicase C-terminal domain-containing protein [Candidatus Thorarchaeota archaeon]